MPGLTSQDIHLGSGNVYLYPYTGGGLPSDSTMEKDQYLLGRTKDGVTLKHKVTNKSVSDYRGEEVTRFVGSEVVTLVWSVLTWNGDVFSKITQNAETTSISTTTLTYIGGPNTAIFTPYIVRFVSKDGSERVTLYGTSTSGFNLQYSMDSAAIITVTVTGMPMPWNHKLALIESTPS